MNTSSKNGFIFGLLMPGGLGAAKEATMYSYNGVVLPKLPVVDGYDFLTLAYYPDNNLYRLYVSKRAGYVYSGLLSLPDMVDIADNEPGGNANLDSGTITWGDIWTADNAVQNVNASYVFWTNHDIHYADDYDDTTLAGTLFLAASSEPVPVYE